MASLRVRQRSDGTTAYAVLYREGGIQRSETFADATRAETFRGHVDALGAAAALEVLDAREHARHDLTLAQWCHVHIDQLTGVTDGTRRRYRAMVERDLGALGPLPLTAITKPAIAKWVNTQDASGLAAKTIANRHGFLYSALENAVREGHIATNPCKGTRLPKSTRREMVFLSHGEFALLLTYIRPDAQDLVTFLAGTGLRWGEATALQVQDIDFAHARITVARAWKWTGTEQRVMGAPKTSRSRRTIAVPPQVLDILVRASSDKAATDVVFTNSQGKPWTSAHFHSAVWQPAVEYANGRDWEDRRRKWAGKAAERATKARVPHRTPAPEGARLGKDPRVHDLRHTCASWMIQAGVPLPVVQRHLGHESITTTVDRYGHLEPAHLAAAADALAVGLSSAFPQIEASHVTFVTAPPR